MRGWELKALDMGGEVVHLKETSAAGRTIKMMGTKMRKMQRRNNTDMKMQEILGERVAVATLGYGRGVHLGNETN